MMRSATFRNITTLVVTIILPFAHMSVANATPTTTATSQQNVNTAQGENKNNEPPEKVLNRDLTPEELATAEAEMNDLFTIYLQQDDLGHWTVNERAARENQVDVAELSALASQLNKQGSEEHSFGSDEYRKCVLNAVGLGALTGTAHGGGSYIKWLVDAKDWRSLAYVVGRVIGVNALKGGIAGTAATLAAAGSWCATPWAA